MTRSFVWARACLVAIGLMALSACQTGGNVSGNDGGSDPINEQETNDYKKAILKCYKTGGSRVVKIEGKLRCF